MNANIAHIAGMFKERRFAAGETITMEGAGAAAFFVIDTGQATVTLHGKRLATLGRGDYFGETALIDDGARSATVTATSDVVCHGLDVLGVPPTRADERHDLVESAPDAGEATARGPSGLTVARIGFSRNLGARADQAGLLVSAVNLPVTFQRTLMPRPLADQAIVTGLSVATNHALVALLQEAIQAAAFVVARPGSERARRRALEPARVGARRCRDRRRHRGTAGVLAAPSRATRRAAIRTGGFWLSVTGAAGAVVGGAPGSDGCERGPTAPDPPGGPAGRRRARRR